MPFKVKVPLGDGSEIEVECSTQAELRGLLDSIRDERRANRLRSARVDSERARADSARLESARRTIVRAAQQAPSPAADGWTPDRAFQLVTETSDKGRELLWRLLDFGRHAPAVAELAAQLEITPAGIGSRIRKLSEDTTRLAAHRFPGISLPVPVEIVRDAGGTTRVHIDAPLARSLRDIRASKISKVTHREGT